MPVEPDLEVQQRLPEFLDRVEGLHPQELLFQGADESLAHTVTLGSPDKARAGLDTQKGNLVLKGGVHVLWPMVMPQDKTLGDTLGLCLECSRTP